MLSYRTSISRATRWRPLQLRAQPLLNPKLSYRQNSTNGLTGQGRWESARSKWKHLPRKYRIFAWLTGIYSTLRILSYAGEPPEDVGLFSQIANEVVLSRLPPKQVQPPYVHYQPITRDKEIRLLVLEPGTGDAEIICRLIHVQPSWRTRYEALSYVWGDASDTRKISCSGTTKDVPANLHSALTDLRHPTRERLLWVDNLCINQDDKEEKTKQINMMRDIYAEAHQVLIYLGKTEPSDKQSMHCIRQLDRRFKWAYFLQELGYGWPVALIKDDEISWNQVISLLSRPWFLRTWVIQEAVLAQRSLVFCGRQSVPWTMLERVVLGIEEYRNRINAVPGYESIEDAVRAVRFMAWTRLAHRGPSLNVMTRLCSPLRVGDSAPALADDEPRLLDLILESYAFNCTMASDKIFGMLGLTGQDIMHKYLEPGYAVPAEEVFRNFTLWDILHNNSLRVLGASSVKANSQHLSPSWVPQFDKLDRHHSLTSRHNLDKFDASGGLAPQARVANSSSVLYLKGRKVDTLHTISHQSVRIPPMFEMHEKNKRFGRIPEWYLSFQVNKKMITEAVDIWIAAVSRATQGHGPIPAIEEILPLLKPGEKFSRDHEYEIYVPSNWEPFLRTLQSDRTWLQGGYRRDVGGEFITENAASFVRIALLGTNLPNWILKHDGNRANIAQKDFLRAAQSRHFAGTEKGLIGWVPVSAKTGDLVCILYGSEVPVVLRRIAGDQYVLIGECYMNGIMYGEALKTAGAKDETVEFAIV